MIDNDFMLARNSGTPPVRLLFDKSLGFVKYKKSVFSFIRREYIFFLEIKIYVMIKIQRHGHR